VDHLKSITCVSAEIEPAFLQQANLRLDSSNLAVLDQTWRKRPSIRTNQSKLNTPHCWKRWPNYFTSFRSGPVFGGKPDHALSYRGRCMYSKRLMMTFLRVDNTKSGSHAFLNSAWTAGFRFSRNFQATVPVSTSSRSYPFPSSGSLHTYIELTFGKSLDWIHGSENLIVARAAYYQITNPCFYGSFESSQQQGSKWSGFDFFYCTSLDQ